MYVVARGCVIVMEWGGWGEPRRGRERINLPHRPAMTARDVFVQSPREVGLHLSDLSFWFVFGRAFLGFRN